MFFKKTSRLLSGKSNLARFEGKIGYCLSHQTLDVILSPSANPATAAL